ncbi:MAG: DNA mismatch repair protein MutS [Clostridia bacterium]|nr:DNA mismatch repair protein MutS [Clostridia bacterium]
MNIHHKHLEFDIILQKLADCAYSVRAKDTLLSLEPSLDEAMCQRAMQETSDAKRMLISFGAPPLAAMENLEESLCIAQAGGMLSIEQLEEIVRFCVCCKRMTSYLERSIYQDNMLSAYSYAFEPLSSLQDEIESSILHGAIRDDASTALKRIRHSMFSVESRIKEKLNHVLQTRKAMLSDHYYVQRSGRYALPVRKQYQSQFGGTVVDQSRTGGTVFMEPNSIANLQVEMDQLLLEEELECHRILYSLSDLAAEKASAIRSNAARMTELDVLFAKAQLSEQMHASPVAISCGRSFVLRKARHPLLNPDLCVPLDLNVSDDCRGIVITGPNTGGKTVALKTIGLLTLMAQCGLHIPCDETSCIPMRDAIYCDIGDSQSLTSNLSTFSGHMTNVLDILGHFTSDSLILLDELGSGTDPTEGMGIAVAILEHLRNSGCFFMVTTHYPEVKTYVKNAESLMSARMAFDEQTLRPLYRLEMGKSGKSCALEIIRRLGMENHLLTCARQIVTSGVDVLKDTTSVKGVKRHGRLKAIPAAKQTSQIAFQMGDSVEVMPEKEKGIVYAPADELGNVTVQIKGEKKLIRHTRIRLLVPASELYPDDYDFSIIFDTVENRKARHTLDRKHDASATIIHRKGES